MVYAQQICYLSIYPWIHFLCVNLETCSDFGLSVQSRLVSWRLAMCDLSAWPRLAMCNPSTWPTADTVSLWGKFETDFVSLSCTPTEDDMSCLFGFAWLSWGSFVHHQIRHQQLAVWDVSWRPAAAHPLISHRLLTIDMSCLVSLRPYMVFTKIQTI